MKKQNRNIDAGDHVPNRCQRTQLSSNRPTLLADDVQTIKPDDQQGCPCHLALSPGARLQLFQRINKDQLPAKLANSNPAPASFPSSASASSWSPPSCLLPPPLPLPAKPLPPPSSAKPALGGSRLPGALPEARMAAASAPPASSHANGNGSHAGMAAQVGAPTNPMATALLTDQYQFSMAYAYWKAGKHADRAV